MNDTFKKYSIKWLKRAFLVPEDGGRMTDDRKRKVGNRRQKSPVKFAALVFFEEFNGASRGPKSEGKR
jgi:hypothetical protein